MGYLAGQGITNAANSTCVGLMAGSSITTAGACTFIGHNCGHSMTTGTGGNTALGYFAAPRYTVF